MAQMHLTPGPRVDDSRGHAALDVRERSTREESSVASGPGWFESSWELGRGLEVREGLPANLGLAEWLTLNLVGPQPGLR
jgi:hypothetical protein